MSATAEKPTPAEIAAAKEAEAIRQIRALIDHELILKCKAASARMRLAGKAFRLK